MIRGLLPLVLAVLSLAPVHAAELRPVMPADTIPAVYEQWTPDVATDGKHFVAVWSDDRMRDRPNFTQGITVYATALDAQGQALTPYGLEIAPRGADSPNIASNGRSFVVTYNVRGIAWMMRVGTDGRPLSEPVKISEKPIEELVSNGTTYAAIGNAGDVRSEVRIFDEEGRVTQTLSIDGWSASLVPVGSAYMAFTSRPVCPSPTCESKLVVTVIQADGSHTERAFAQLGPWGAVRTVSNGSRVLVAWYSGNMSGERIAYTILNSRGGATGPVQTLHEAIVSPPSGAFVPSVAWDGESFLVAWGARAARISTVSTTLEEIDLEFDAAFRAAFTGSRVMLTSAEVSPAAVTHDPVARSVRSFRELAGEVDAHVITFSPSSHSEPDVDAAGNVAMAVAREGQGFDAITGTIFAPKAAGNEQRVVLAPAQQWLYQDGPSVGAAGDLFLVVWREVTYNRSMRILARRVSANGTLLDANPIVIATERDDYNNFADTDVAYDGRNFLVVWHSADNEVRAQLVRRDGVLVDGTILVSRHASAEKRERHTPAVVWTGELFLIAWSETIPLVGGVSPTNPLRNEYRSARVTRDGAVLDEESRSLYIVDGYSQGLALASGADRVLLVTSTGSYLAGADWFVHAFTFDLDGTPLVAAPSRLDNSTAGFLRMHPAAAWSGSAFLVFWNERVDLGESGVVGVRLSSDGTLAGPVDLADVTAYFPSAARYEGGVVMVETALTPAQANVARLHATTYPISLSRTRAVRP